MKTIITESELINRARGLREYLNVLEAKFDPNVKALQDKLIQAGATIKADGFMGPATQAAMKQFPNVTTQTDAQQAVGTDLNTVKNEPEVPAQAPTSAQAERDDAAAVDKANPPPAAPAPAPAAAPATPNPWEGKDPAKAAAWATLSPEDQKWLGGADPTDKFILARAPKKGAPATPAANPADVDIGFGPGKFQPDTAPAAPAPAAPAPAAPVAKESVGYSDESILARIVELSRR